jgi:uncharacterized repeat protein (TIGR03803 family)
MLALAATAQAQTFTVLHNFAGSPDGAYPIAALIRDAQGNLYGTTVAGGSSTACPVSSFGCGTVFKVDTNGNETVLYSFAGGTDGAEPYGLIRDAKGNLYGITQAGGGTGCYRQWGCGTVFAINGAGEETILYSFTGGTDGAYPSGTLIRDSEGSLYGTASEGGNVYCSCGVVFKVSKTGEETVLHTFGGEDGAEPTGGVISDKGGNLYGTTQSGGSYGNVFKLSKSGTLTTLFYFSNEREGRNPNAGVTFGQDGTLYGTTLEGGAPYEGDAGWGTVFRLNNSGVETVLHSFGPWNVEGGINPWAGVIRDAKGNLYGDTEFAGPFGGGLVFKLDASGTFIPLHNFVGPDGRYPFGNLLRDANGTLYGTASGGGTYGYGTVWKLTP